VASPRTQVLWGRAFGSTDDGRSLPAVVLRRSPVPQLSAADPALTNTRQGYSSPPAPARPRNRVSWLAAGAVLALGAVATTVLPRGFAPRDEQLSRPLDPGAVERSALERAVRAAPVSSDSALGTSAPSALSREVQALEPATVPRADVLPVGVAEEPAAGGARRKPAPGSELPSLDAHGRRRSRPPTAAAGRAATDSSTLSPAAADSAAPASSRRPEPEPKPPSTRARDSVGANQSPFLD
jgi:hypothetical protein